LAPAVARARPVAVAVVLGKTVKKVPHPVAGCPSWLA